MNEQERLNLLEKKVKRLQYVNYVRFGILVLTFLGVTAVIFDKLKKIK